MQHEHRTGELCLLVTAVLEGLYPILVHQASHLFSPLLFVGSTAGAAAVLLAAVLFVRGEFRKSIPVEALYNAALVALFILGGFAVITYAAKFTSGINTALLMQSEMLFAFLICGLWFGEKQYTHQVIGALVILAGTSFVLFNGSFDFNIGDILILIASALFPLGNRYAKRALDLVGPMMLLFLRYAIAAMVLLPLSFLFEEVSGSIAVFQENIAIVLSYTLLLMVASKLFWYYGLSRLTITKATYIISSDPAFALVFAFLLLGEVPNMYQWVGFTLTIGGVYLLITKRLRPTSVPDLV